MITNLRIHRLGKIGVAFAVLTTSLTALMVSSGAAPASAAPPVESVTSARLADTRPNEKTVDGQFTGIGRRPAMTSTTIKIAGRGGVPADASAVMINLTSVQPDAPTFLTAYPCDNPKPNASNVNSPAFVDRANSVFVKLSEAGTLCIYNEAAGDFVIDVNGFVPTHGYPIALQPARLLDTRPNQTTFDGKSQGIGRPAPRSITTVQIAGRGGVPADATAAVFNLTAEFPDALTVLTAFPCDGTKPDQVSSLNLPAGDTRANSVFVKLSAKGTVCIFNEATSDIIIDINGYVPTNGSPTSINPARIADSRPGSQTIDGKYLGFGRPGAMSKTVVQVAGRGGVPSTATAALINLTAENPSDGTYLTAYPCDANRPDPGSNLNLPAHDTGANTIFAKLSATGTVCVYTVAPVDIIIDVNGYVAPPSFDCTVSAGSLAVAECEALVTLFNKTGGATTWTRPATDNWMTGASPCAWEGVICTGGHVTELDLVGGGLTGALPPEIGNLVYLKTLTLRVNKLTGLPATIGSLKNLTKMDISSNVITSLPSEIGNLTGLQVLYAYNNKLTTVPVQLGNLVNLTSLDLSTNHIAGDITAAFAPLKSANKIKVLVLELNGCMTTNDASLKAWLTALDPLWATC